MAQTDKSTHFLPFPTLTISLPGCATGDHHPDASAGCGDTTYHTLRHVGCCQELVIKDGERRWVPIGFQEIRSGTGIKIFPVLTSYLKGDIS